MNFEDVISRDNKALLVQEDINTILNDGRDYVLFDVSVSNSGHCVRFRTSNDYGDFDDVLGEDIWDGYSYALEMEDFEELLERHGVIMEIGGKFWFIWEVL